jgi:hypothetical protein
MSESPNPSKLTGVPVKFEDANPNTRLSQAAIEAIARLLLSIPYNPDLDQSHALAA